MKIIKLKLYPEYIEEYKKENKAVEIRLKDYNLEIEDKIEFFDMKGNKQFEAEVSFIRKGEDIINEDFIQEMIVKDMFIRNYLKGHKKEIVLIYLTNIKWVNDEKSTNN